MVLATCSSARLTLISRVWWSRCSEGSPVVVERRMRVLSAARFECWLEDGGVGGALLVNQRRVVRSLVRVRSVCTRYWCWMQFRFTYPDIYNRTRITRTLLHLLRYLTLPSVYHITKTCIKLTHPAHFYNLNMYISLINYPCQAHLGFAILSCD